MEHVELFVQLPGVATLGDAAAVLGKALGIRNFEERESSNYIENRYFAAKKDQRQYELSYTDYEEADRFPFHIWIELEKKAPPGTALLTAMDAWVKSKLLAIGAKAALVVNYGRPDMQRIDY
jgi:hypothetical protein